MNTHSRLVIVYGALRSGSTMLRLMLDGHPRLCCPCESDFMFDHVAMRDGQLCLDVVGLRNDWVFAGTGMTLAEGSVLDQLTSLADQTRNQRDIGILVLHRQIDLALDVFPEARVIHLLRDPRDVARSSIPMGWAGNVYCGVDHWINTEDAWTRAEVRLPPQQVLEVRYEDLVRAPDFAGVGDDAGMMDYHQRSTYALPDRCKVEQWRRHLSPHEVGLVEAKLGSRLDARGYKASGLSPVPSGALKDLMLRAQSKRKVWARRFEDYGLVDPIIATVARRIRLPALARAAQKRIDSKIMASLK
jgi:hypothetical protein